MFLLQNKAPYLPTNAQYVLAVLFPKTLRSKGGIIPWRTHPLNDVSLVEQHISWTMCSLDDASLTDVSRSMIEVRTCWASFKQYPSISQSVPKGRGPPIRDGLTKGRTSKGTYRPTYALYKGRNIRYFMFGDTTIRDDITLRPYF
jgi:hypothetical protein